MNEQIQATTLEQSNDAYDLTTLLHRLTEEHKTSVSNRIEKVNSIVAALSLLQNDDSEEIYSTLFEKISNNELSGDADDYHNIAVAYSRHQQPERASQICSLGLKKWPENIDLNADALTYMMDAGNLVKAEELANSLQKNCPDRSKWNWRGFTFLLDYYQTVYPEEQKEQIISLISDFKMYLPQEERAYLCDAKRYESLGEYNKAIESLEDAISKLNAPQCALKLTDLYFERAKYDDAIRTATLGIAFAAEPQPSIRTAYLLFLRALSKDALYLKCGNMAQEDARRILEEYKLAKKYVSSSEARIIDLRMDIIATYASIPQDKAN